MKKSKVTPEFRIDLDAALLRAKEALERRELTAREVQKQIEKAHGITLDSPSYASQRAKKLGIALKRGRSVGKITPSQKVKALDSVADKNEHPLIKKIDDAGRTLAELRQLVNMLVKSVMYKGMVK